MPPIYRVELKVKDAAETRLIEAANMAVAMRYVAGKVATVEKCTTAEAVNLGARGIKVENANGGG